MGWRAAKDRRGLRLVPRPAEDTGDGEAGATKAARSPAHASPAHVSALAEAAAGAGWWTLSDEISPEELRAFHQLVLDKVKHLPVSALTPELVPMWQAFDSFALGFVGPSGPRWQLAAPRRLAKYGLSREAAGVVVAAVLRFLSTSDRLQARLQDDQAAFVEIQRQALAALGRQAYTRALDARDTGLLALMTGHSPARVSELMGVWERDPVAECAASALSFLAAHLDDADWQRLRRFLLHEHACETSLIGGSRSAKVGSGRGSRRGSRHDDRER